MEGLPTQPLLLNRALVCSPDFQSRTDIDVPSPELLELPEKAVQFGTGAFLRGFVEFFLDEANRQGAFGGRVVVVGSTGSGRDRILREQDGLYTLSTQGTEEGVRRDGRRVIASVSRALSSETDWGEVLDCARNPAIELVFSNTTEVGIRLDEQDDGSLEPPRSFPGKLTRFLAERARAFDCDPGRGLIVIPCELIEDNGTRLRDIVLDLARRWQLGDAITSWLGTAVTFCNTLVDRIVPGAPGAGDVERIHHSLGYRDGLITTCEVYRLFAIEGDDTLRSRLRFVSADPGIVVTDDIAPYRERKVRILNGTHTIMAPVALMCGCETVREAMRHELIGRFIRQAMFDEIVPSTDAAASESFALAVLDRFSNPFVHHALIDIMLQATTKMRVRVVPSIVRYGEKTGRTPELLAFGFAAFLLFVDRDRLERSETDAGTARADGQADRIRRVWAALDPTDTLGLGDVVRTVCGDVSLWGTDLNEVPAFADAVTAHLVRVQHDGVAAALATRLGAPAATNP